ncbi:hypothetical protein [Sphingomonas adhaesiva]|uniref:hypothetical protein n=1 Tax=Sphingomonas adhaesiva TaxID=28212 RepID=UPI002FFCDB67
MKPVAAFLLLAPLAACATDTAGTQTARPVLAPIPQAGLQTVMGQDAAALVRGFGTPDADVREGTARKLQFSSAICIMDAYLYPAKTGAEPRVTWVDTRQRDGSAIDRASCVAALSRRTGGK